MPAPRRGPGRPRGGPKPIDLGTGIVCASLARDGRWLSLGAVHRGHGFVELAAVPDIDPAWRARPALVRRYRAMLADERLCFLDWAVEPTSEPTATRRRWLVAARQPGGYEVVARFAGWTHRHTTLAIAGTRELVQRHVLRATGASHPTRLVLHARGQLDRPALAQVTEIEPPAATGARTEWSAEGGRLRLTAAALPAQATIEVGGAVGASWQVAGDAARLAIDWPAGAADAELRFDIVCAIAAGDA